ncbi:PLP-dependent aminotransferase family protein [Desulfovibrio ferrophilus]|uniref:2-aminoadipate transaminase n=1 Tax=Desulfovibrio ferrophilus TaxID=241368 RepID=A0A2Z6AZF7_9BACT|nr:PLP-dependent aminotransferase family protein [Desulfovibrio ferrophilus]BBD08565.1 2-aminoadipate transaminase [Desulfovibrio ferrophilus]
MSHNFANRMQSVPRSFIREILKVTQDPTVISFAGGLPNPALFPSEALAEAARTVIADHGGETLQYSTTEGHPPLREWIAARYRERDGLDVSADDIMITTGSQQALDLMAKVLIDPGDTIVMESPGYLGAIQAFSMFEPKYETVNVTADGPDLDALERALAKNPKLFYAVTSFQNPSGLTYSDEKRQAVAEMLKGTDTVFAEDNPYGDLRFAGERQRPLMAYRPEKSLLLGTFSKIAAPGFRIGWVVADPDLRHKLVTAKQAADLHTSTVSQRIVHRWLEDNDLDEHIAKICDCYGTQCNAMLTAADEFFPEEVTLTRAEGGMFLWAEMPEGCSSMKLFDLAIKEKVAFVPGNPFYVDGRDANTLRLNYTNAVPETITEGMKRLGKCMKDYIASL